MKQQQQQRRQQFMRYLEHYQACESKCLPDFVKWDQSFFHILALLASAEESVL